MKKSLPGLSLPIRFKINTNIAYVQNFNYANTIPTVPCVSIDKAISLVPVDKRSTTLNEVFTFIKFYEYILSSILQE